MAFMHAWGVIWLIGCYRATYYLPILTYLSFSLLNLIKLWIHLPRYIYNFSQIYGLWCLNLLNSVILRLQCDEYWRLTCDGWRLTGDFPFTIELDAWRLTVDVCRRNFKKIWNFRHHTPTFDLHFLDNLPTKLNNLGVKMKNKHFFII